MINFTVLPDGNLKITADNATRQTLKDDRDKFKNSYWAVMGGAFEAYSTNGKYTHFDAAQGNPFVGLTSAPCVAESIDVLDDGTQEVEGRLWYFSNYMTECDLDQLIRTGKTIYILSS